MTPPLNFSPVQAFLFDFDGTLAKLNIDFSAMKSVVQKRMAASGISAAPFADLPVLEMIDAAAANLGKSQPGEAARFRFDAHELITTMELEAAERGALFDRTKALLTGLADRSIRSGVVTRNCRAAVFKVFPDIAQHCRAVLTREDTERVKPHPDHLHAALRELAVHPSAAIMVGDHPLDILLGQRAGIRTIGVLTGHSGREAMRAAQADWILDRAEEILNGCF